MANNTTTNKDIDYIAKDFSSTTDAIISFATVNYGPGTNSNRVWTDFNPASFSRNFAEIVSYVADLFAFYFDTQATNSYLQTATVQKAITDIAAQFGYEVATAASSSGTATFTFSGAGNIARGFRVASSDGQPFYLTSGIVAATAGNYFGSILQGSLKQEQFTATGLQNEEFNLGNKNVVKDLTNLNPLDISPTVSVAGNSYTLVNTFINSTGTNTAPVTDSLGNVIGGGGRVFELDVRATGTPYIRFGDGTFGRKLNPGEVITVNYRTGGGSAGNIGAKVLTTKVDSNPVVTGVTNAASFSGGADAPSIEQLRQLIPTSLTTLNRAVSKEDYANILITNFPQVQDASAEQNTEDLGVDVNIYVVPSGNTITPISANTPLKTQLTDFIELRKMVTVQFQIRDAYGLAVLMSMEVHISNAYSQSTVIGTIKTALTDFFNLNTGGTSGTGLGFGSEVLSEDISTILRKIEGITRFEVKKFTYRPRIDMKVLGLTTDYIASSVEVFPAISQSEWLLAASGSVSESTGSILFHNTNAATFTYNSSTGLVQYTSNILPETLNEVSPGDLIRSGNGVPEITHVTTVADVSGNLNSKYFYINSANDAVSYYVWYNVNSAGIDPLVALKTGIQVSVATNATAIQVATATKAALDLVAGTPWSTLRVGNLLTISNAESGPTTNATAQTSGFTVAVIQSGLGIDAKILGVDSKNKNLYISPSLAFNTTPGSNAGGSIRQGATSYQSFKCFKKINAVATNLAVNSLTDTNLDLSVKTGTAALLSTTIILDNTQTFIPGEFSTGEFYLVDSSNNIWEIVANDSDTITTGLTAVNDFAISAVSAGDYKIVTKLTSFSLLFNSNIFNINYNNHNTLFSIGGQFNNIGTIGNSFQISQTQTNVGNLGVALDLISHDPITGIVQLNSQPDLTNVNSNEFMIDSSGQIFRITAIDNRLEPSISYDYTHQDSATILKGLGSNVKMAQGFKVSSTATYPVVSWQLKREGNIAGVLTAQIVHDNGSGLPNLASVVANGTSLAISASAVPETFTKVVFNFSIPPTLTAATQYHLVLFGDTGYNSAQKDNIKTFDNDAATTAYTYDIVSGVIQYATSVGLSSVIPGNYIKDRVGNFFKVLSVNTSGSNVTLASGLVLVQDSPVFSGTLGSGSIYIKDNIYVGFDASSPTYSDGKFETYNGTIWSAYAGTADAIFSVEGPKTITVNSNLTPVLGLGATVSSRYYDDNNEVSFILGNSYGSPTSATDVNAFGLGTVTGTPNSKVDTFVFRSSRYNDDIINLRSNEIPELASTDINIQAFGGIV